MERDMETLAAIEALDNGKTVAMAKIDVAGAAGSLRYYGGWADKIHGQTIDTRSMRSASFISKRPRSDGVTLCQSPSNAARAALTATSTSFSVAS
jgi:acyl-CoA reductase-like NAD-dependent aldehyde dehydrogenase